MRWVGKSILAYLCSLCVLGNAQEAGMFVGARPVYGQGIDTASLESVGSISADGKEIYFNSNRPWKGYDENREDIYKAKRNSIDEPFGNVEKLNELSTPVGEGSAKITRDGFSLYFTSNFSHEGHQGFWDIYVVTRDNTNEPFVKDRIKNLGPTVNSEESESGPSISCDELTLVFMRFHFADQGQFDLYMSKRESKDVEFPKAEPLGNINSEFADGFPSISCDGRTLFFSDFSYHWDKVYGFSPRPGGEGLDDLWWTWRESTDEPFKLPPENLGKYGAKLCTKYYELVPVVDFDWPNHGSVLYWSTDHPHPLAYYSVPFQATWLAGATPGNTTFMPEPPMTEGAINCGGLEVDATSELGFKFERDRLYREDLSWTGDAESGFVVTQAVLGHEPEGMVRKEENSRDIDVSQIQNAGSETAKLFATNTWSPEALHYQARVVPGRYDVTLYFAEDSLDAVNFLGQGTRIVNVSLNGERVLCYWSAASAAGNPTGSGNPRTPCIAVIDTAIARTFSLDVPDGGNSTGMLNIIVQDLGGCFPPGNPTLNAFSFKRTGDVTGMPISGDLECPEMSANPPSDTLLEENFEDAQESQFPPGMECNDNGFFSPQVVLIPNPPSKRLRLTEDFVFSTATTAIFYQTVNVKDHSLTVEFDLFLSGEDFQQGEGGSFFVLEGGDVFALGEAGGGLGIPLNGIGFAVEFDTAQTEGLRKEPSGLNAIDPALRWPHVGINSMCNESTATNVDYDPNLKPVDAGGTGWPNFFDPEGVHVKITYSAGHVQVELSGLSVHGEDFGPQIVAEADVPLILSTEAVVGFSGSTGMMASQTLEVDNIILEAEEAIPDTEAPLEMAIQKARDRWDDQGELYINCGGNLLACGAGDYPAPQATGDAEPGDQVTWISDLEAVNEFFTVVGGLQAVTTDMGFWDARGTGPGVDENDRIFHSARMGEVLYEIPVLDRGPWEVTLYFANPLSNTAGTGLRAFQIDIEGVRRGGFLHCEFMGKTVMGKGIGNPFFEEDELFDPVDAAEHLYSTDPCNFEVSCPDFGVTSTEDPDRDRIPASEECGNAAAVALLYEVEVEDALLTIELSSASDLPLPSDPIISGISIRRKVEVDPLFKRGDVDGNGVLELTDVIRSLNFKFVGGDIAVDCLDAADLDDNGALELTDDIRSLNYQFSGSAGPPEPPGPFNCDIDPTIDDLDCQVYKGCK